jgi:hypothetical protein
VSSSCENRTCRISLVVTLPLTVFFDKDELLRIGQACRDHHFSTSFQLVDQRRGERSRCHDHLIERRMLGPAMIAIGNLELDVGAAPLTESLLRLSPELR